MKCPECGTEMKDIHFFLRGEPIFGGRNYGNTLYQCPKCKTIGVS